MSAACGRTAGSGSERGEQGCREDQARWKRAHARRSVSGRAEQVGLADSPRAGSAVHGTCSDGGWSASRRRSARFSLRVARQSLRLGRGPGRSSAASRQRWSQPRNGRPATRRQVMCRTSLRRSSSLRARWSACRCRGARSKVTSSWCGDRRTRLPVAVRRQPRRRLRRGRDRRRAAMRIPTSAVPSSSRVGDDRACSPPRRSGSRSTVAWWCSRARQRGRGGPSGCLKRRTGSAFPDRLG